VGVDVFFVISGFVITGVLLRERRSSGRTSLVDFYARRVRRILPAATLVILVTVVASYVFLGAVAGNVVADDGRWAAVFLSNFHFASVGTSYLTAHRPPSPLQNYWSLSVEEQFYVVYPTLFLALAAVARRTSYRVTLAAGLVVVVVLSFALSVSQTASSPTTAYFSPFTRAWELALGALVAVGTPWLARLPVRVAAVAGWAGMAAIVVAAVSYTSQTAYPGSLVAVPVVGAGLVIAAGVVVPRAGPEAVLGTGPMQWLGRRSYSLYLWHWPILVIAAERVGKTTLPLAENLVLVAVALAVSVATYALFENPLRHLRKASRPTVAVGLATVLLTVAVLSAAIAVKTTSSRAYAVTPAISASVLQRQVAAARDITRLPDNNLPPPSRTMDYWGGSYESAGCRANAAQWKEEACTLGDRGARRLAVVYGDSHALMWLPAFDVAARAAHWRLVVLAKDRCPAELVTVADAPPFGPAGSPDLVCRHWHQWALAWIAAHHPQLLVVSQFNVYMRPAGHGEPGGYFTAAQWSAGLAALHRAVHTPGLREVFLGGVPGIPDSSPACLAKHAGDVQACSAPAVRVVSSFNEVERSAARAAGMAYVDTVPWFCTAVCTAVVGHYDPYYDPIHVNAVWAVYLAHVVAQAVGLPEGRPGCRADDAVTVTPGTLTLAGPASCAPAAGGR
jgi:peptidoglycan/LPS O-acetylase OafA/YrhL